MSDFIGKMPVSGEEHSFFELALQLLSCTKNNEKEQGEFCYGTIILYIAIRKGI